MNIVPDVSRKYAKVLEVKKVEESKLTTLRSKYLGNLFLDCNSLTTNLMYKYTITVSVDCQGNFKGKLAHTFSTCYLECFSFYFPMDKKFMSEKI